MKARAAVMAAALAVLGASGAAAADGEERIALRDGTVLVGRVVAEDEETLRVVTEGGLEVGVPRASVVSRRTEVPGLGRDPNYSRLMFAPTGRPLAKGDGYFSDYEVLFPGGAYGITDNVSIAGGVSTIPGLGLDEQVLYVAPKVGWNLGEKAAVSVGGLFASAGDDGDRESLGIGFAIGTFGRRDASASIGFGIADTSGDTDATALLMLGGAATVSRHVALVGETWLRLADDFDAGEQPIGLAVRFFGDRLSADVGVVLVGELLDEGFPLPWLSVTYHFGGGR